MHCGVSLRELHGALVYGEEFRASNVFVEQCSIGMCSSWVHCTLCPVPIRPCTPN